MLKAGVRSIVMSLIAIIAVAPGVARAEVGVSTDEGTGAVKTVYKLRSITDDPDPTGASWVRYHADGDARKVLNDQGQANGDGRPSVATSGNGAVAVWARNSPTGFDVVISQFAEGPGSWSAPAIVAGSAADELDPVVVVSPSDGSIHVLYWVDDASPRVLYTQAPADLSSWTPAIRVSLAGEAAARPSALLHDGTLQVAYESHGSTLGSTPRQIVVATKSGSSFTSETVATTSHPDPNWPEIHGRDDRIWVDWIDAADEMAWACSQSEGPWTPVQTETFSSAEARDYHVRGQIRGLALQP